MFNWLKINNITTSTRYLYTSSNIFTIINQDSSSINKKCFSTAAYFMTDSEDDAPDLDKNRAIGVWDDSSVTDSEDENGKRVAEMFSRIHDVREESQKVAESLNPYIRRSDSGKLVSDLTEEKVQAMANYVNNIKSSEDAQRIYNAAKSAIDLDMEAIKNSNKQDRKAELIALSIRNNYHEIDHNEEKRIIEDKYHTLDDENHERHKSHDNCLKANIKRDDIELSGPKTEYLKDDDTDEISKNSENEVADQEPSNKVENSLETSSNTQESSKEKSKEDSPKGEFQDSSDIVGDTEPYDFFQDE